MIVMDATRLPNCAASMADPVARRASDAPAEKLSPAPQISTGFASGWARTQVSPVWSTTSTPSAATRDEHAWRLGVTQEGGEVYSPKQRAACALRLLQIGLHQNVTEQMNSGARIREENALRILRREFRQQFPHGGCDHPALAGLRLIRDQDDVERFHSHLQIVEHLSFDRRR